MRAGGSPLRKCWERHYRMAAHFRVARDCGAQARPCCLFLRESLARLNPGEDQVFSDTAIPRVPPTEDESVRLHFACVLPTAQEELDAPIVESVLVGRRTSCSKSGRDLLRLHLQPLAIQRNRPVHGSITVKSNPRSGLAATVRQHLWWTDVETFGSRPRTCGRGPRCRLYALWRDGSGRRSRPGRRRLSLSTHRSGPLSLLGTRRRGGLTRASSQPPDRDDGHEEADCRDGRYCGDQPAWLRRPDCPRRPSRGWRSRNTCALLQRS